MVKELTEKDVEFTVEALPEDMPLEGNLCSYDDEEEEREEYARVKQSLEEGNEWAWCVVRVTARWKSYEGTAYLSGCSYESERNFKDNCCYLPDLKTEALEDLNRNIEAAYHELSELED